MGDGNNDSDITPREAQLLAENARLRAFAEGIVCFCTRTASVSSTCPRCVALGEEEETPAFYTRFALDAFIRERGDRGEHCERTYEHCGLPYGPAFDKTVRDAIVSFRRETDNGYADKSYPKIDAEYMDVSIVIDLEDVRSKARDRICALLAEERAQIAAKLEEAKQAAAARKAEQKRLAEVAEREQYLRLKAKYEAEQAVPQEEEV